jgi:polyhydroxyalkanoate synthase
MKRFWNLATLGARPKPQVGVTPADVVHRENKWRLLHYRPRAGGPAARTPLLLVPSLINRHYVLDLMPGKSFAEYLVAAGHDVYVIDWGTPGDEDRYLTFDEVVDGYLGRAVRHCARASARGQTHLLGYCLGGTLTAIYAAARPAHVATLTGIAAPVRFDDDGLLARWTRSRTFDAEAIVAGAGNVPWQLMQSAFHLLRPTLNLSKAVHLLDRAWDDQYLDGFLALETWGNDNVSFPGECFKTLIRLYREDALARDAFTLAGRPVRLGDIRCPTLAVTFEHDNIVPWPSAAALTERVGAADKERIHLPGGHVGAVVSRAAAKALWPALSAWWAARDGEAAAVAAQPVAAPAAAAPASARTAPAAVAAVKPPDAARRTRRPARKASRRR